MHILRSIKMPIECMRRSKKYIPSITATILAKSTTVKPKSRPLAGSNSGITVERIVLKKTIELKVNNNKQIVIKLGLIFLSKMKFKK